MGLRSRFIQLPRRIHPRTAQSGFSLIDLTVVLTLIGLFAMVGLPKFRQISERARAVEAFSFLQSVGKAQEMYMARHGEYARDLGYLEFEGELPIYFEVGPMFSLDWQRRWQLRLTRVGASSGYGNYCVTYTELGFTWQRSSVPSELTPIALRLDRSARG